MENNKSYLDKIPLMFLLIIATLALQELILLLPIRISEDNIRYSYMLSDIVASFMIFIPLSAAFNKWNRGWWCIAAYIVGTCINTFVFENFRKGNDNYAGVMIMSLSFQAYTLLVFLFFFLDKKLSAKKIWLLIVGLLLMRGTQVCFYSTAALPSFIDSITSTMPKYSGMVMMCCFNIVRFIYLSELQNFADGKAPVWNIRLLNPGNSVKKLSASIAFFAVKTFLVLLVLGLGYIIFHFVDPFRSSMYKANQLFQWMEMFNAVCAIAVAMMAAWWLRKFLLEYCISHGINLKISYWLLILPFAGFFAWIVLLQNEEEKKMAKRISNIDEFASSDTKAISTVYVVLLVLLFLVNITKTGNMQGLISVLLSIAMFLWFIHDRTAYYFNFYLNVLIYFTIVIWFFVEKTTGAKIFGILYPLSMANLIMLLLILPVYHFYDFTYVVSEENALTNAEERDLLKEFDE